MSDWKAVAHVTGSSRTYTVYRDGGGFVSGYKFLIKDDGGKSHGIYDDKGRALRIAEEKAGRGAHINHV